MPVAGETTKLSSETLKLAIAALDKDYSKLKNRIAQLTHAVTCECAGITLRVHYPALRQCKATVLELVDAITLYLADFCLTRSEIQEVKKHYGKISSDEYGLKVADLVDRARSLFKTAQEATNRNGEAGELLLYLLTEWILGAPQLVAKMGLKTNKEMAVHGADGIHVHFCDKTKRLFLYWGEAKLYKKVDEAIKAAVKSIVDAIKPEHRKHEINLVKRSIDLSGFNADAKEAVLSYLDPFSDEYKDRHDVITCLIGFDFDAFTAIESLAADDAEVKFQELATKKLKEIAPEVAAAFKAAKQANAAVELFFFPLPAVKEFRDLFQTKIGWKE